MGRGPAVCFVLLGVLLLAVVVAIFVGGTFGNLTLTFPPSRPIDEVSSPITNFRPIPISKPIEPLANLKWNTFFTKIGDKALQNSSISNTEAAVGTKADAETTFVPSALSVSRRLEIQNWLEMWNIRNAEAKGNERTISALSANAWWKLKQMISAHANEMFDQNQSTMGTLLKSNACQNDLETRVEAYCKSRMQLAGAANSRKIGESHSSDETAVAVAKKLQSEFLQSCRTFLPTMMPHSPVDWIAEQLVALEIRIKNSKSLLQEVTWLDYFEQQWADQFISSPTGVLTPKHYVLPKTLIEWAVQSTTESFMKESKGPGQAPTMQNVEDIVKQCSF